MNKKFEIQFNTSYYTLNIIFSQALAWIVSPLSPFLLVLQLIKLLTVLFIKSVRMNSFALKYSILLKKILNSV